MLVLPYSQANMKVIKPFFLGALGGLALALAALLGIYFSSLRNDVYFAADPEMADARAKLGQFQEWLAQADLRLAQSESAPEDKSPASDSLRNAQTKAWRDYKAWRNRLGELARAHDKPTADGIWPWTYSLRYWFLPGAVLFALLPGLFFGVRARMRFRPGRVKADKAPTKNARSPNGRSQALANFEDAVKKVARISETGRSHESPSLPPIQNKTVVEDPRAVWSPPENDADYDDAPPPQTGRGSEPPTTLVPASAFVEPPAGETQGRPASKEPDTVPIPLVADADTHQIPVLRDPEARDAGRETAYFQVGTPWGEPAGERIGSPVPPPDTSAGPGKSLGPEKGAGPGMGGETPLRPGLSMEDEDAPRSAGQNTAGQQHAGVDDEEETLGVMPPTTEVERVERRKEEVLKLARKGMTSSEISRRMRISQDQVEFIIRLRREKG